MNETITFFELLEEYNKRFPKIATPTLRDRFAMAALTGMLANPEWNGNMGSAVRDSYKIADAMLEARKQNGGDA